MAKTYVSFVGTREGRPVWGWVSNEVSSTRRRKKTKGIRVTSYGVEPDNPHYTPAQFFGKAVTEAEYIGRV